MYVFTEHTELHQAEIKASGETEPMETAFENISHLNSVVPTFHDIASLLSLPPSKPSGAGRAFK